MFRTAALLAALLTLTGCLPDDTPTGYRLHLSAVADTAFDTAQREVECTIIGYAQDQVVTVTDTLTGETRPYQLDLTVTTPATITIHNYAEVERIEYICTMFAQPGDSLHCETLTAAGRPAPMSGSVDFALAEGGHATCSGIIQTTV